MTIPLRSGRDVLERRGRRESGCGPVVPIAPRSAAPSTSATMPPGIRSWTGIGFASPERLSTRTIPVAPACLARPAFETNEHVPRETSAIAPLSELAGSWFSAPFGSAALPHRWRSTGWPFVPDDRADVDELLVRVRPRVGRVAARLDRHVEDLPAARVERDERRREDLRVRDRCDRDRVRRGSRRARRAESEVVAVVPRRDDRARRLPPRRCSIAAIRTSFTGSDCGPPPEKLMTSMPSLTVCSNASAISGRLGDVPDGRRQVEDAVVAEVGLRRDAGEPAGRRMVVAGGRAAFRVAGCDARDVRAVERRPRGRARACPRRPRPGRGTRARR